MQRILMNYCLSKVRRAEYVAEDRAATMAENDVATRVAIAEEMQRGIDALYAYHYYISMYLDECDRDPRYWGTDPTVISGIRQVYYEDYGKNLKDACKSVNIIFKTYENAVGLLNTLQCHYPTYYKAMAVHVAFAPSWLKGDNPLIPVSLKCDYFTTQHYLRHLGSYIPNSMVFYHYNHFDFAKRNCFHLEFPMDDFQKCNYKETYTGKHTGIGKGEIKLLNHLVHLTLLREVQQYIAAQLKLEQKQNKLKGFINTMTTVHTKELDMSS